MKTYENHGIFIGFHRFSWLFLGVFGGLSSLGREVTGHSLGGAVAVLAMVDLVDLGWTVHEAYTFGMPRAGDATFARAFDWLRLGTRGPLEPASVEVLRALLPGDAPHGPRGARAATEPGLLAPGLGGEAFEALTFSLRGLLRRRPEGRLHALRGGEDMKTSFE